MPSANATLTLLSKVTIDLNESTYRIYKVSRFSKSELFETKESKLE